MDEDLITRIVLFVALVGSGLLMVWMAHATATGKLKRNRVAGIRIPSTLESEEAWLAAHIRAKRPTLIAGYIAIGAGLIALLPLPAPALAIVALGACVLMLALVLYGARVGSRAAREVTKGPSS
ncbi:SdpI family protein [Microbacterium esteraromaticum]|uniref:SdpI family protein n=1 Tax=Microbacterium esteraromaticum TaxID=57043 RepID=A0A7D8AN99_9MICO|nr:SdpI family protein [Microbacterium esteraromaticum]QMU98488.1 SdpI family protein [Microbacterium esteraromaticum]